MASNNKTYDGYYLDIIRQILIYKIQIEQLYCYETLDDDL